MLFSIVIPNLNSPVVDRTITSLEIQEFDRSQYEVIVVGMDRLGLVRESQLVRFDRSDSPLSPAQARNQGANHSNGEIIAFIDADCVAAPDWLSILGERFKDPNVAVVGGGIEFEKRNYWTISDNLSMFYEYLAFHPAGERRQLPSLNLAIRRSIFIELGGFDERYPRPSGEDADLTIRLRYKGYCLHFEPDAVIYHLPPRDSFKDLLRHAYYQGQYSTKMDPRYSATESLPGLLHTRAGVLLFAPFLAAASTLRIYRLSKSLWRYWLSAPAIYLAKLAWCIGASQHAILGNNHGGN
jgi:cellulose synthase/poly-beta-1,6-N-acetylglucosamine synthase-like glycosyltransferase